MNSDESWENIIERGIDIAEVKWWKLRKGDDFPRLNGTAESLETHGLEETLKESAGEVKEVPVPTKNYKRTLRVKNMNEAFPEVFTREPGLPDQKESEARFMEGMLFGAAPSLLVSVPTMYVLADNVQEGAAGVFLGGLIGYSAAGNRDIIEDRIRGRLDTYLDSKLDEKQVTSDEEMKAVDRIDKALSEAPDELYGFKAFRGGCEWPEILGEDEVRDYVEDLSDEAEVDLRIKRKDDYPVQVIGITAKYPVEEYQDRIEIANEVAEDENLDASMEEILDVSDEIGKIEPVPTEDPRIYPENTFRSVIVTRNPDYYSETAQDYEDHHWYPSQLVDHEEEMDEVTVENQKIRE